MSKFSFFWESSSKVDIFCYRANTCVLMKGFYTYLFYISSAYQPTLHAFKWQSNGSIFVFNKISPWFFVGYILYEKLFNLNDIFASHFPDFHQIGSFDENFWLQQSSEFYYSLKACHMARKWVCSLYFIDSYTEAKIGVEYVNFGSFRSVYFEVNMRRDFT